MQKEPAPTAHSLITQNGTVVLQDQPNEQIQTFRLLMQNFHTKINALPSPESIDKTPDGKAGTILISHIEMLLDEYFFGLWETENFKWAVIANEIVGSIDLVCTHPVTNQKFRRVGAASIQIMVNAGTNALDVQNKKSNALDMGFPKLKTECLKNAANSLGKLFGRDLNRKKADAYQPLIKVDRAAKERERIEHLINDATLPEHLDAIIAQVPEELKGLWNERMKKLTEK